MQTTLIDKMGPDELYLGYLPKGSSQRTSIQHHALLPDNQEEGHVMLAGLTELGSTTLPRWLMGQTLLQKTSAK
jgi:hypothetical protein